MNTDETEKTAQAAEERAWERLQRMEDDEDKRRRLADAAITEAREEWMRSYSAFKQAQNAAAVERAKAALAEGGG